MDNQATVIVSKIVGVTVSFIIYMLIIGGGVFFVFKWAGSAVHSTTNFLRNGLNKARGTTSGLAKKAASNSVPGQMLKQGLADRKAAKGYKANQKLQEFYNRNPEIVRMMGANRIAEAKNRRLNAEKVEDLRKGITSNVANGMATGQNLNTVLADGHWTDSKGNKRALTSEDRAGIDKLRQQGYIDGNGNVKGDAVLATAAMKSIMDAEIATDENVRGVSGMLKGASHEDNAQFSEELRAAAAAHKYKNFSTATVDNGVLSKYYNKTGELEVDPNIDPVGNLAQQVKGAKKVIASGGLRDINKDALDPDMDQSFQIAINEMYNAAKTPAEQKQLIVQIADQTKHIEKDATVQSLINSLSTNSTTPGGPATPGISAEDFKAIQRSIKSGGATPMPPGF